MNRDCLCIQEAQRENKHTVRVTEVNEVSTAIDIGTDLETAQRRLW